MSVGLLIITHHNIGEDILRAASYLFDPMPLAARTLSVSLNCDPDSMQQDAARLHDELNSGDGVLILTDIFGSTPSNIAASLLGHEQTCMISGLSLPMLVRVFNYATLDLEALSQKAVSGGHDGIIHCTTPDDCL